MVFCIFMYLPYHVWWFTPDRRESERRYYRHFDEKKTHGYFLLGYESPFTIQFRKEQRSKFFHVEISRLAAIKDNVHITVVGDLYITTRVPKAINDEIIISYNNPPLHDLMNKDFMRFFLRK